MTIAQRDLASAELWDESLARSLRRRELSPQARRQHNRRKRLSIAVAAATMAGPGTPMAMAQVSGDLQAEVAAETPSKRAIEVREGGLPLVIGSQGPLVAEVQKALQVQADGIFGPQTEAAVRSYQTRSGLAVDGIVGPNTWSTLFAAAAVGGSDVPQGVREHIEQRLESAGDQMDDASAPAAPTDPASQAAPAPTSAPGTGSCGSATIATPVSGTTSSPYGPRGGRNHDGVDIAAPSGTPVRAAACGNVSLAGQQSGYGNIVCVTHTSRFSTCYAHLSQFATSQGAQVRQGEVLGYVGCTGNCTGPHLHFETRVDGQAQNPSSYLGGTTIPGRSTAAAATTKASPASTPGAVAPAEPAPVEPPPAEAPAVSAPEGPAQTAADTESGALAAPVEPVPVEAPAVSAPEAPAQTAADTESGALAAPAAPEVPEAPADPAY